MCNLALASSSVLLYHYEQKHSCVYKKLCQNDICDFSGNYTYFVEHQTTKFSLQQNSGNSSSILNDRAHQYPYGSTLLKT